MEAEKIISHCVKLGFPPESIPDKQYLEKIHRTRNCQIFNNFVQQSDVRDQVDCVRRNILVHASKDENKSKQVPHEIHRFLRMMSLKQKIQDARKRNDRAKQADKDHLNEIQNNCIRKMKIENSLKSLEITTKILQAKSNSLSDELDKETSLQEKINLVTPTAYNAELKIVEMNAAIINCLSLIRTFYSESVSSNSETSTSKLWENIRKFLKPVPNIFIYQVVMKQLAKHCETLSATSRSNESSNIHTQQLMSQLYQMLMVSGIETASQKNKMRNAKSLCSEKIQCARVELEELMSNNGDESSFQYDEDFDIVDDFVSVLLQKFSLNGKLRYANEVLNELKKKNENNEIAAKEYSMTVQTTGNINIIIDAKIMSVQHTIAQIHQINDKVNFGKISMIHLVQDLKVSKQREDLNRSMMNVTLNESSICGTPAHQAEVQAFLETPIEKFNTTGNVIACELNSNHLLLDDDLSRMFKLLTQADPTNINKFFKTIKIDFEMNEKLKQVLYDLEPKVQVGMEVSITELLKERNANRETISELLDQISRTNVSTKSLLREINLLYNYSLNNPLKKFLPLTKKFEGKCFKEYENEFRLYYKMLQD